MSEPTAQEPIPEPAPPADPGMFPEAPPRTEPRWLTFLYEFLIVALGISVPFLLDRWNQNMQDRRAERQVYENLRREVEEDRTNLDFIARENLASLAEYQYGKRFIVAGDRSRIDTLARIAFDMSNVSDFHRNSTVYETLVNSGDLQLIGNREVLQGLQDLEEWYIYMNRLEENHLSVFIDQILPELIAHMQLEPPRPLDPDWFFSHQLDNLLQVSIFICQEKSDVYRRADQILSGLQERLDAELNKP